MSLTRSNRNNIHSTLIMVNSPPFTRLSNGVNNSYLKQITHILLQNPDFIESFEKFPLNIIYYKK